MVQNYLPEITVFSNNLRGFLFHSHLLTSFEPTNLRPLQLDIKPLLKLVFAHDFIGFQNEPNEVLEFLDFLFVKSLGVFHGFEDFEGRNQELPDIGGIDVEVSEKGFWVEVEGVALVWVVQILINSEGGHRIGQINLSFLPLFSHRVFLELEQLQLFFNRFFVFLR